MVSFRIADHTSGRSQVVEVWYEGQMIATIYGRETNSHHVEVSLITRHGIDVREEISRLPFLHCVYTLIEPRGRSDD